MTPPKTVSLQGGVLGAGFLLLSLQQHPVTAPRLPEWLWAQPAAAAEVSRLDTLEEARARWKSIHIADYVITVMAFRGFIHTEAHTITVKGGKVVSDEARCASGAMESRGCVVESLPAEHYSVDGLLSDAEETMKRRGEKSAQMKYDPVLGIPLEASYDDTSSVGSTRGFWVEKFERSSLASIR